MFGVGFRGKARVVALSLGIAAFAANFGFAQDQLYTEMFPLSAVKLLDGPLKDRQELNGETLLAYDTDKLIAPFYEEAGMKPKATKFSNWAGLDGHVLGHYLSALAMHYAATGDTEIKKRMEYVVDELEIIQKQNSKDANFVGYISGVPNGKSMWLKFKNGDAGAQNGYWVPWYNIHKTYAGLRDAWMYGGVTRAKDMFLALCDWGITITNGLNDSKMESMMGTEYGGMNEVYADAYEITKNSKYLDAAKKWSHKWLLNAMASNNDVLSNRHANTQVPKVVGFARVAELSGDKTYKAGAETFWDIVVNKRSIAIGGNSISEHFPEYDKYNKYIEEREGPESCNTYNMLKLTERLFHMTPSAKYADFYERALFNHILSTIHPTHGGYCYFTPARPRHYRVYSKVNAGMWCCVGSGMENPGKYAQFIYTKENDALYVNLYAATELNWTEKGVKIKQETAFPKGEVSKFTVSGAGSFKMMLRHPYWVKADEFKVVVNGDTVVTKSDASSYVSAGTVKAGDVVEVIYPMHTHIEELRGMSDYVALLHGPIVLSAKTGTEGLSGLVADDGRWSHIAGGALQSLDGAPMLASEKADIPSKLTPVKGEPLHFKAPYLFAAQKDANLLLEPFYEVHDARYMMYWMVMTDPAVLEKLKKEQEEALALDEKTVDKVAPGEQQPEADHRMKNENSSTGTHQGEFYRDAGQCSGGDGGFISYELETNSEDSLDLMVRYWGNEGCNRAFDIMIDDKKLASENISNKWKKDEFVNVKYPIPDEMVKGKKVITVKFQASTGMVGGIFGVRLLRNKPKPEPVVEDTTDVIVASRKVASSVPQLRARANSDVLQIEASSPLQNNVAVKIFSMDGRLVKAQTLNSGSATFSIGIGDMKNGMYIMRVLQNGNLFGNTIFTKKGI